MSLPTTEFSIDSLWATLPSLVVFVVLVVVVLTTPCIYWPLLSFICCFGLLLVRGFASNPPVDSLWVTLPCLVVVTTPWVNWPLFFLACHFLPRNFPSTACERPFLLLSFLVVLVVVVLTTPWVNWPLFFLACLFLPRNFPSTVCERPFLLLSFLSF